MNVQVCTTAQDLGAKAAAHSADVLNRAIAEQGYARLVLSTGASQFETLQALTQSNVNWSKVEVFHLDEYINLPRTHIASFRKYLEERFVNLVTLKKMHYVETEDDVAAAIAELTEELRKAPIDLALIGIGENGHIAFNDPPANFDTKEAYIVVELDDACKKQQVSEGWFATVNDVPNQAVTMTVHQIMESKVIVSCVPHESKANAVKLTLENEVTNRIPATMLKTHPNWTLFLDKNSSALTNVE